MYGGGPGGGGGVTWYGAAQPARYVNNSYGGQYVIQDGMVMLPAREVAAPPTVVYRHQPQQPPPAAAPLPQPPQGPVYRSDTRSSFGREQQPSSINFEDREPPALSVVTYFQAELKDERPLAMQSAGVAAESSPSSGEPSSALTPALLEKILRLAPAAQEVALRILERQTEADGAAPASAGSNSRAMEVSGARTRSGRPPGPKPATVPNLPTPARLSPEKLLGGRAPSLEEIRDINRQNLALTKNAHVASTTAAKSQSGSGPLELADEERVRETLIALNPQFADQGDALLAAMKAKLSGEPIADAFMAAAAGKKRQEIAPPEIREGAGAKCADPGWSKVCHRQTHTLHIAPAPAAPEAAGDAGKPAAAPAPPREVPVVLIYEDPPVFVFSDLFSEEECEALCAVGRAHWQRLEAAAAPTPAAMRIARLPIGRSSFIDRLVTRIASALQVPQSCLVDLAIRRYFPEDKGAASTGGMLDDPKVYKTSFLVFLNTLESGGQLDFVKLGFQVQPRAGTAVMWHNVRLPGTSLSVDETICPAGGLDEPEDRMLYAPMPPEAPHTKLVLSVYVRKSAPDEGRVDEQKAGDKSDAGLSDGKATEVPPE